LPTLVLGFWMPLAFPHMEYKGCSQGLVVDLVEVS